MMQASELLRQLIDAQRLLEVRIARHVCVVVAGISVGQIASMMRLRADQRIGSFSLRATAIVNELHLVGVALLSAAEHNVDVVAAARQVDVAWRLRLCGGLHPGGALIQIRLLATAAVVAALVALETFTRITRGGVCSVGVVVVGGAAGVALLKVVLVLELKCIARLEGIVLGVVEHIAHIRIALGQVLMYILAGYLQVLIQIRVALYVVVATVVERLPLLVLMEQHRRGLLELAVIVAATTSPGCSRGAWPVVID